MIKSAQRIKMLLSTIAVITAQLFILTACGAGNQDKDEPDSSSQSQQQSTQSTQSQTTSEPGDTEQTEENQAMKDSELYYGTVKEVRKDDNNITQILLDSEKYGEYLMNVQESTVWVDGGKYCKDETYNETLKEGEGVYIFHSPIQTRSLPPQSPALAIVRNTPMDAGQAMYHKVEELTILEDDGQAGILTDGGSLKVLFDDQTEIVNYQDGTALTKDDIKVNGHIMAWYSVVAEQYPGQTYTKHILVLPEAASDTDTVVEDVETVETIETVEISASESSEAATK